MDTHSELPLANSIGFGDQLAPVVSPPDILSRPDNPPEPFSWLTKPLRLSVNPYCIDKNANAHPLAFTAFTPTRLDVEELLSLVKEGYAYGPGFQPGKTRSNASFEATDLLSVDVDGGMTWQEALDHPLVGEAATFLYQTVSHTEEEHRFRIGFVLPRTIIDPYEMRAATRSLALRLNGDASVEDPARIYFGNRATAPVVQNRGISADLLSELIKQGWEADKSDERGNAGRTASTKSIHTFDRGEIFRSPNGATGTIDAFSRSDALYCPYHRDRRASAFVIQNQNGEKGVRCSKCAQSFWRTGYNDHYDFYSFVDAAKAVGTIQAPLEGIDRFIDGPESTHLTAANIHLFNDRYLGDFPIEPGATFIRSPKGSGKTELLANLVARNPEKRFLLIGHRRSLIRTMCSRLGITCYLDADQSAKRDRYGVCLDSLMSIRTDRPYDYVLIDESEQVLAHFLSNTMREKRVNIIHRLAHIVSRARHVVALDADLSWNSFRRICEWRQNAGPSVRNTVIINEHRRDRGAMVMVASKRQIMGEIKAAAVSGKRCFVTSNSRGIIERLHEALRKQNPDLSMIAIHSQSVSEEKVAAFLLSPRDESLKYQLVLASPSLGTGVDFTFDRDADRFDIVFGIFEPLVLSHFDCDQQLARVREPREVRVFVNPATFEFETDIDTVTADALSYEMMAHLIQDYNPDGTVQFIDNRLDDSLLRVAASVLSVQRASKNRLKDNFIGYAIRQGWTITAAPRKEEEIDEGTLLWTEGGKISKERLRDLLMSARSLDDAQYDYVAQQMADGRMVATFDRASYARTAIEKFYNRSITPELIVEDANGALRRKATLFDFLTSSTFIEMRNQLVEFDFPNEDHHTHLIKRRREREDLMVAFLNTTPIYDNGAFNLDLEFSTFDLQDFVAFLDKHRVAYETQFERPVRKDLDTKPVSQLNTVLKFAGLKTVQAKPRITEGQKVYFYRLDRKSFQKMKDLGHQRQ